MELPFLESYEGQSTDELITLRGKFRIDSIVLAFEEALSGKEALSDEERVVLAVEAMEREVNNGGFAQLFVNSSREQVSYLVRSLTAIGCPATAVLVQGAIEALALGGNVTPESLEEAVINASEEVLEFLSELDSRYYEGQEEPISEHLFSYIVQNRERISLVAP